VSVVKTVEDPIESALVNDLGTLYVLETARRAGVRRVVLASSSAVYGDDPEVPKNESMPARPKSPYAIQKYTDEMYAAAYNDLYGIETVCLRYFNVYGPRQDPSSPYSGVISLFMTRSISETPPVIYGDGNQYRDFVYVKDVVEANLQAAAAKGAGGKCFNVGTGRHVTINALWDAISGLSGFDASPEYLPPRPGDILESVSAIDRAEMSLNYRPDHSLEKGLALTFAWYKDSEK
jgi:UDP-glucose 4-epimerase